MTTVIAFTVGVGGGFAVGLIFGARVVTELRNLIKTVETKAEALIAAVKPKL